MASSSSSKRRQRRRRWSDGLPDDVLVNILRCLHTLSDFFAFRGVCKNWRNVAKPSPYTLSSQSPLLVVSRRKTQEALYDVAARRTYRLELPWYRRDRFTMAYSHGHLITNTNGNRHGRKTSVLLWDLFTGATTLLPLAPYCFERILISARPDSAHCLVVTVVGDCGEYLQFLKVGDTSWTFEGSCCLHGVAAMTFFKGDLLSLSWDLTLFAVELGKPLRATKLGGGEDVWFGSYWLGECDGVLMSVCYSGQGFKVFQWNSEKKGWDEIHDLGDKALFLGDNGELVSVLVTGLELRKNCLYYTFVGTKGWEEYSLVDSSCKKVKTNHRNMYGRTTFSTRGVWVFPNNC